MARYAFAVGLRARRLFVAALAVCAPFYAGAPLAQNPGAALLDTRMNVCPVDPSLPTPVPVAYKPFNCAQALQEGWDAYKASCAPQASLCQSDTAFYCGSLNDGNSNFSFVSAANPGGSCNNVVSIIARCPDGSGAYYHPSEGWQCPSGPYASATNTGAPRCPDGQCEKNPVNPAVGNKYQVETDYVGAGPLPLTFVRYYNSIRGAVDAAMGPKWTHTYSRALLYNPTNQLFVSAQREDGKVIAFRLVNAVYVADATFSERLEKLPSGWTLKNLKEEIETYDDNGRLVSIADRAGLVQTRAD